MLPIIDEITVLSLLHPCTPCTLVEINEVKCIRQGAHKSNRISSSLFSHNIGLSLKYIYMNMSEKCYLCTYVVYHITCMLGDNKDIVNCELWIMWLWIPGRDAPAYIIQLSMNCRWHQTVLSDYLVSGPGYYRNWKQKNCILERMY